MTIIAPKTKLARTPVQARASSVLVDNQKLYRKESCIRLASTNCLL